jgi:hypothetical protein
MNARAMCLSLPGKPLVPVSRFPVLVLIILVVALLLSSCDDVTNPGPSCKKADEPQTHDYAYQYADSANIIRTSADTTPIHSFAALKPLAKAEPKVFKVKADKDTVVVGNKGVLLRIGKNSFDLPNPNAEVKIELKEYASTADFFFSGLSTTSNGQLLESGGTVFISATADGKEVKLKEGATIELAFPSAKPKPGMQTFYGKVTDDGSINWQPTIFKAQTVSKNKVSNNKTLVWKSRRITKTRMGQKISMYTDWNFQVQAYGSNDHCTRFTDTSNYKNVLEYFQDNFNIPESDRKLLKGTYLVYSYKVDDKGNILKPELLLEHHVKKGLFKNGKQKVALQNIKANITKLISEMPATEPTKYMGREMVRFYVNDFNLSTRGAQLKINDNMVKRTYTDYLWMPDSMSLENFQKYMDSLAQVAKVRHDSLMKTDADYYMMNTAKLGWINCDRFYNAGRTTNVVVDAGTKGNDVTVKIIFKDILSVMPATRSFGAIEGDYTASGIPTDKKVKVMVVDKRRDGSVYYAIKEYETGGDVVSGFDYKPMTFDAVRKELDNL